MSVVSFLQVRCALPCHAHSPVPEAAAVEAAEARDAPAVASCCRCQPATRCELAARLLIVFNPPGAALQAPVSAYVSMHCWK